jgi:3-(3-hydroxy-phenyl)propionate hydroxylase
MKKTDVVIVGAGPVGCVAGYYLARKGIDVTVIDAGEAGTQDLRASTFHPSTLEMLDTLGIADELIEMGLKAPVFQCRERSGGETFRFDHCISVSDTMRTISSGAHVGRTDRSRTESHSTV